MPSVLVHMRKGRTAAQKRAVLDAIHESLVESFKIPAADRFGRILEFEPEDFDLPSGKTEACLVIEMTVYPGRSLEAKRSLYAGLVRRLEAQGVLGSDVMILLREPPLHNWGIRGGKPASEVDLGYAVDV